MLLPTLGRQRPHIPSLAVKLGRTMCATHTQQLIIFTM
jgi:hypothetical protein